MMFNTTFNNISVISWRSVLWRFTNQLYIFEHKLWNIVRYLLKFLVNV